MTYQVIREGIAAVGILRDADGVMIPLDELNSDYVEFLAWNETQTPPLSLEDLIGFMESVIVAPDTRYPCQGRLTLESGAPVSDSDQTGKTVVYFTPYNGNGIALFNGTYWNDYKFSEVSIKLTDTQTGTTDKDAPNKRIITGLTDTSQFIVGMLVTGAGVGTGATIVSIDSLSQVTVDVDSTADGTVSITFKVPASKNLDVFAYDYGLTPKLMMIPWTNDTTRAYAVIHTQDGVYASFKDSTWRYLGTIRTTATAGQTEDSTVGRYVWNYYNQIDRKLDVSESTAHVYNGAGRKWNNSDTNNYLGMVCGISGNSVAVDVYSLIYAGAAGSYASTRLYLNGTSLGSAITNYSTAYISASAGFFFTPTIGLNYLQVYEASSSAASYFYSMRFGMIWRS